MKLSDTRQQILTSEEFVINELRKVQRLYGLKKIIRYNHTREHEPHTESDAEHIFGMHCLVDYFLPLEDTDRKWDRDRIRTMVQYHEIDEIVTGDIVGYHKSSDDLNNERTAAEKVITQLPESMQQAVREALDEYEAQSTPEAKFAKAIDKIEPVFHIYNEAGKQTLATLGTTKDQHDRIKFPYLTDFPIIKRFGEVMTNQFEKEGFYHPGA